MHTESALKRWLAPLVDPKIFDFWAAHLSRTWRWDRRLARVSAVTPAAEGATTLTLRWGRRAPALLPGQHVNITVDVAGVRHTRAYSPTLLDARQWQITVREQPGGCVSHFLSAPERVGSTLEVSAGFGDMLLPQDQAPWLLLAAGSGITPFRSLLRAAAAADALPPSVTLLYWADRAASLCFADEFDQLAADHPQFHWQPLLTREGEAPAARINAEQLAELAPLLAGSRVYSCGPAGFVSSAEALVAGQALQVVSEAFSLPPLQPAGEPVTITLARSGRQLTVPGGTPLLAALEQAGERPPHGCRMGICNTCSCGKQAGTTEDLLNGALSAEPITALRLCVSSARSDLTLDL